MTLEGVAAIIVFVIVLSAAVYWKVKRTCKHNNYNFSNIYFQQIKADESTIKMNVNEVYGMVRHRGIETRPSAVINDVIETTPNEVYGINLKPQ